jgi:hypothetical protein
VDNCFGRSKLDDGDGTCFCNSVFWFGVPYSGYFMSICIMGKAQKVCDYTLFMHTC